MKMSSRERKLLFFLSFLLWVWALTATVSLYRDWKGNKRQLEHLSVPAAAQRAAPGEEKNLLLGKLLTFEGRGLTWPEDQLGVNLLDYLRHKAGEAGLSVKRMSLEPPQKVGPHRRLSVLLELTGQGEGFVAFFHSLAQGEYACDVAGLELEGDGGQLEGRVALEFFRLDQKALARQRQNLVAMGAEPKVPVAIQPLSFYFPQGLGRAFLDKGKSPLQTEAPPVELDLSWPTQEEPFGQPVEPKHVEQEPPAPYSPSYSLSGIVYQQGKPMALLSGPEGQVLLVEEGADLDGERVVKITKKGVLLARNGQEAWLSIAP